MDGALEVVIYGHVVEQKIFGVGCAEEVAMRPVNQPRVEVVAPALDSKGSKGPRAPEIRNDLLNTSLPAFGQLQRKVL